MKSFGDAESELCDWFDFLDVFADCDEDLDDLWGVPDDDGCDCKSLVDVGDFADFVGGG